MTRDEAERRAAALSAGGSGERWFARQGANGWEVVKLALPPGIRLAPTKPAIAEVRRPPTPGAAPAYHRHFDGQGGVGGV
jgi:hypothetical protein